MCNAFAAIHVGIGKESRYAPRHARQSRSAIRERPTARQQLEALTDLNEFVMPDQTKSYENKKRGFGARHSRPGAAEIQSVQDIADY
jgi:hypothetical protein